MNKSNMQTVYYGYGEYKDVWDNPDTLFKQCDEQIEKLENHHECDQYEIRTKYDKADKAYIELSNETRGTKLYYTEGTKLPEDNYDTFYIEKAKLMQRGFIDLAKKLNDVESPVSKKFFSNQNLLNEHKKFKEEHPDEIISFSAIKEDDINYCKKYKFVMFNESRGTKVESADFYPMLFNSEANRTEFIVRSALKLLQAVNNPKTEESARFFRKECTDGIHQGGGLSMDEILKLSEKK